MIISPHAQGTPEWHLDRAGVLTASEMSKAMSKGRGAKASLSLTRQSYMRKLANETITGKAVIEGFKSKWMERGTDQEHESRQYYEMITGNRVQQVGLIYLNELKRIGASVDGLIGEDGNQELKNPKLSTHLGYCLDNDFPDIYKCQVQTQLWVTEREWCDFASYHPEAYKMLFLKRVYRDEIYIKTIKETAYKFIGELDVMVEKMRAL